MERGHLDGGDVMLVGEVAYVGLSARTDSEGARELGRLLEVEVRAQPVRGFLHLKTAVTPLSAQRVLKLAGALSEFAFQRCGVEVIETDEPLGANVLWLGERAMVSSSAPRTAARLERLGLKVEAVELGEFHAGDAGVTCLSVLFG
jgi:dimethylargininase